MTAHETTELFKDANRQRTRKVEEIIESLTGQRQTLKTLHVTNIIGDENKIRYGIISNGSLYSGIEKWHLVAKPDHQHGTAQYHFYDYRRFNELQNPEISKPEKLHFGNNASPEEIATSIIGFCRARMIESEKALATQKGISVKDLPNRDSQSLDQCIEVNGDVLKPTP